MAMTKTAVDRGTPTDEESIVAYMQSIARQQSGRRLALDVGARDGYSSQPYAEAGWSVIALDIVMQGLSYGLKDGRIRPGRAVVADGRHLPFCDAAFDLVSSRWFLHEFPDQPYFLREMKRVVRDSGRVVAVDFAAPGRASQVFLNQYILPDEHARTCGEFAETWAEAGLAIETIEWRTWRLEEDAGLRKTVCGPDKPVPEEVKTELHITCDDKRVFLDVPLAVVVARKGIS